MWLIFILLYLCFTVLFTQFYKIATKSSVRHGTLTVLLQLIGGISVLLLCPLFSFRLPKDPRVYIALGVAVFFYAISDRINTTVRSGIEASTYNIIQQLSTIFMILAGLFFFKEPFLLSKIISAALILFSNILIFYKRGAVGVNKYVLLAICSNLAFTVGLFLDVNISELFNLPFYVALSLLLPALFISLFERIRISWIREEWEQGNKRAILTTSLAWGVMLVCLLRAYQLGEVTSVAPLCAVSVMLNVIVGYVFLGEKDSLLKKLIAAVLIIVSVVLM